MGLYLFIIKPAQIRNQTVIPTEDSSSNNTNPEENPASPSSPSGEGAIPKDKDTSPSSSSLPPSSGIAPAKPYGTFISNHRPSLSGRNSVPSAVESVCQGTPGAKCYIVFTKDGKTKNLPEKTIGRDGSVDWEWDVKTAGFSVGSWKIEVISSLNGQSASATDSLNLEVQP